MRAGRIVSSYILRVVQRGRRRHVTLYDLHSAELLVFANHREALVYLERLEGTPPPDPEPAP